MGFWGFDRNPLSNLAQWQSKYINIVALTICHSKQLYITVFQLVRLLKAKFKTNVDTIDKSTKLSLHM